MKTIYYYQTFVGLHDLMNHVQDIDTIIVSTDCHEIASVVKKYSPLIQVIHRPEILATDTASSDDVLLHVLDQVNQKYTHFLFAEPTSPFRTIETIEKTIRWVN